MIKMLNIIFIFQRFITAYNNVKIVLNSTRIYTKPVERPNLKLNGTNQVLMKLF